MKNDNLLENAMVGAISLFFDLFRPVDYNSNSSFSSDLSKNSIQRPSCSGSDAMKRKQDEQDAWLAIQKNML